MKSVLPTNVDTSQLELHALVYDILPSRGKVPESDARSVKPTSGTHDLSMCRVLMHVHDHGWPWLIEFSCGAPSCFTLSRLTASFRVYRS